MRNENFAERLYEIVEYPMVHDQEAAYKIATTMYERLYDISKDASDLVVEKYDCALFTIYAHLDEAPLHHFLHELAQDSEVPIAAAARAWLPRKYLDDIYADLAIQAITRVQNIWKKAEILLEELYKDPHFADLLQRWEKAVDEDGMPPPK